MCRGIRNATAPLRSWYATQPKRTFSFVGGLNVEVLVVAGGGAGGRGVAGDPGGGGGAGGVYYTADTWDDNTFSDSPSDWIMYVTTGAGGIGSTSSARGAIGGSTSLTSPTETYTLSVLGGGGGGLGGGGTAALAGGQNGSSGGGAGSVSTSRTGGTANAYANPPTYNETQTYGYSGGNNRNTTNRSAGGGGGSSSVGAAGSNTSSGNGGSGGSLWGFSYGGGGGGGASSAVTEGTGGSDLGGPGQPSATPLTSSDALPNTGSGGGGGFASSASQGGSGSDGFAVIRYAGAPLGFGGSTWFSGGYTYHLFSHKSGTQALNLTLFRSQ